MKMSELKDQRLKFSPRVFERILPDQHDRDGQLAPQKSFRAIGGRFDRPCGYTARFRPRRCSFICRLATKLKARRHRLE